ncbi:MAG: hypothetical protein R6U98_22125 [Pirellulaceae bacterium]
MIVLLPQKAFGTAVALCSLCAVCIFGAGAEGQTAAEPSALELGIGAINEGRFSLASQRLEEAVAENPEVREVCEWVKQYPARMN